jgi:hypothetical protein
MLNPELVRLGQERHTEPLTVTCPTCLRETVLSIGRRNAPKFCPETCDGAPRARHKLAVMVGPEGETNA